MTPTERRRLRLYAKGKEDRHCRLCRKRFRGFAKFSAAKPGFWMTISQRVVLIAWRPEGPGRSAAPRPDAASGLLSLTLGAAQPPAKDVQLQVTRDARIRPRRRDFQSDATVIFRRATRPPQPCGSSVTSAGSSCSRWKAFILASASQSYAQPVLRASWWRQAAPFLQPVMA